jgi:hypothetical protein
MPTSDYTLCFAATPLCLCAGNYTLAELAYQPLATSNCLVYALLNEADRQIHRVGPDVNALPLAIHDVGDRSDYTVWCQRR